MFCFNSISKNLTIFHGFCKHYLFFNVKIRSVSSKQLSRMFTPEQFPLKYIHESGTANFFYSTCVFFQIYRFCCGSALLPLRMIFI